MTETKSKQRWCRFSIRDLLWLTVVAAILISWWLDRSELKYQIEMINPFEIEQRFHQIERELAEIAECKTHKLCDPPAREAELLMEQDASRV